MLGEDHGIANLLLDAIRVLVLLEEAIQPLRCEIRLDPARKNTGARQGQRLVGGVGCIDLHVDHLARARNLFRQDDGQCVGLLSTRAGRHPRANGLTPLAFDERRDNGGSQGLPGFGVAEEAGDIDHQVIGERLNLVRAPPQQSRVVAQVVHAMQSHAPLNAADQGWLAVARKIMASARPQQCEHFAQALMILLDRAAHRAVPRSLNVVEIRM